MIDILMHDPRDGFSVGLERTIAARRRVLDGMRLHPTRGKIPAVEWGRLSSADPDARADMARVRHDGWGVACKPSGVLVVDLDRHDRARDGFASWVDLLDGWHGPQPGIVGATPTGGRHLWYTNPDGYAGHIGILPGVDLRGAGDGDGSQVVIAGRGRLLRVLGPLADPPEPLTRFMQRRLAPSAPTRRRPASEHAPVSARVLGLCEAVAAAVKGQRNATLYWAACRIAEIVDGDEADPATLVDVLIDAAVTAGLDASEAERTIRSAQERR